MAKGKARDLREGTPDYGCDDRYLHRPRRGYGSEAGDVPVLFLQSVNSPNDPVEVDRGWVAQDGESEDDRPTNVVLCEDPAGFQGDHVYYVSEEVADRWTREREGYGGIRYTAARRLTEDENDHIEHENNSRAARAARNAEEAGE